MERNSLQQFVQFLTQTARGRIIAVVGIAIVVLGLVSLRGKREPRHEIVVPTNSEPVGEYSRNTLPLPPSTTKPATATKPAAPKAPEALPPLSIHAPSGGEPIAPPRPLMPTGRMISCRLVNTVDSSSLDTPIIALVTDDFWFGQKLIIPKGTEVLGEAQSQKMRDRIAAQGTWKLVFASGEELTVTGIALDQDRIGNEWGPTDGTPGLHGHIRRADNLEDLKLFFSTFLAGLAEPFKERETTVFGSQVAPTAKNAALTGIGNLVESYAERVLHSIETESVFVRVPAGKTFWLYTTQPLVPGAISPSISVTNNPNHLTLR